MNSVQNAHLLYEQEKIMGYLEESKKLHNTKDRHEKVANRKIRERKKCGLMANVAGTRYEIIRRAISEAGFSLSDNEDLSNAFLVWTDNFLPFEKLMNLKVYQRVNHFPGMIEICRKDFLAKNFMRMNRLEPGEYSFVPKTWLLPQEHGFFLNYVRRANNRGAKSSYILKPANGAMGHGIRLYRNGEHVPASAMNGTPCVVQEYINNPLLIDGFKCDLRIYVLLTCCDPLRIFIYDEGLVRLGAEKYVNPMEPNGESVFMHLTNYAVNKRHALYVRSTNGTVGSKRSFRFLTEYLQKQLHADPQQIWRNIHDLIVKTVIIAAPHLLHSYRMWRRGHLSLFRSSRCRTATISHSDLDTSTDSSSQPFRVTSFFTPCSQPGSPMVRQRATQTFGPKLDFLAHKMLKSGMRSSSFEILGFDILLDDELKPWLIEVNRSPSFNCDQDLDRSVKYSMLRDTLRLLDIHPSDKALVEHEQKVSTLRRLMSSGGSAANEKPTRVGRRKNVKTFVPRCNSTQLTPLSRRNSLLDSSAGSTINDPELKRRRLHLHLRINELRDRLFVVRRELAAECFELHNCGNWRRIFPTEDQVAQRRYTSLLLTSFAEFHHGKGGDLQNEIRHAYANPMFISEEEDNILDQLVKYEEEEAKLNATGAVSVAQNWRDRVFDEYSDDSEGESESRLGLSRSPDDSNLSSSKQHYSTGSSSLTDEFISFKQPSCRFDPIPQRLAQLVHTGDRFSHDGRISSPCER